MLNVHYLGFLANMVQGADLHSLDETMLFLKVFEITKKEVTWKSMI